MRRCPNGFTLIELLVAAVLLAVGLVGLQGAIGACMTALGRSNEYHSVQLLAERQMTALMTGEIAVESAAGEFEEPYEDYGWSIEVADTDREGVVSVLLTIEPPSGRPYEVATLLWSPTSSSSGQPAEAQP